MGKRFVIVGLAVIAAGVLLAITLLMGPAGPAEQKAAGPIDPDDLPTGVSPAQLLAENGGPLPTQGAAGEGRLTRVDDDRVTMLTWQTIEPSEAGVYDVGSPRVTVEFSPSRVLTVTAEEATIIAPDGAFRRGEFRRDVVVTFYDTDAAEADLQGTRDIQVRVFLDDDAAFDLELGQITSTGPLHLTSSVADFKGRGLSLKYNQLRERIERLIVEQGEVLRFASESEGVPRDRDAQITDDGPTRDDDAPAQAEGDDRDDRAPQFYRARFQNDVHVVTGGEDPQRQAELRGDELEVTFALAPGSSSTSTEDRRGSRASVPPSPAPANETAATESQNPVSQTPAPRSLLPQRDDDVIVTWSGPLVLRPMLGEDSPTDPAHLQLALLAGDQQPATILTARGDHITGASVAYQQIGENLLAAGDDTHPLNIRSQELGELTGTRLELSQETGIGVVLGPGRITAHATPPEDAEQDNAAEGDADPHAAATPSTIAWADRLDLRFFVDEQADSGQRLAALEHVTFLGQVQTRHEDYTLDAAKVEVAFTRADDEPRRSSPSLLLARGDVAASQTGMTFTAQKLDVTLAPRATDDARATDEPPGDDPLTGDLEVARIVAEGAIEVTLDEQDATVTASRLVALPPQQTVELFGSGETLAVLAQPEGRLAGRRILLNQATQQVSVEGPGDFAHRLDEQDPDAVLAVVWNDRMAFDNQAGEAAFFGAVRAHSVEGQDTSELTAKQLKLSFEPQPMEQPEDERPAVAAPGPQRIRALDATGEVAFSATTTDPDRPRGLPRSRLLLEGPRLTFTNTDGVEQVKVLGRGRMLVENYENKPQPRAQNRSAQAPNQPPDLPPDQDPEAAPDPENETSADPVNFAGHGATLFLWTGSLTLDAAANDMTIRDDVQMIHRPQDDEEIGVVQLDCQLLYADLTETGGLTAWSREGTPDATLRLVEATDTVRLSQRDRQVSSDHLRYTAADRVVTLWSAEQPVELIDEAGGSSMTAEALKWDLANDRFEALKLRSGIAPIKRD